ncbi:hypothetical protein CPB86DRAFT_779318 [Serendipita vermifera]|nr:hypothetical protein CPB86DRAFT_779318 [Serendipita vermifera]
MNAHNNIRPYVCNGQCGDDTCQLSFTSAEALSAHKKKERVKCDKCGHLVAKKNMARHLSSHCSSLY